MDLRKYRDKLVGEKDERAVSPVIGVILIVAITVILAAVIAAFVLDMGNDLGDNQTPNTVWSSSQESTVGLSGAGSDEVSEEEVATFTHDSGDSITKDNLDVNGLELSDKDLPSDYEIEYKLTSPSSELTAGDEVSVEVTVKDSDGSTATGISNGDTIIDEGTEITLTWSNGDESSTQTTHTFTTDVTVDN